MKNEMVVPSSCAKNLSPEEAYDGYMFVKSFDPRSSKPTYWGEIKLQQEARTASFSYVVEKFDGADRTYGVILYFDRQFGCAFIEARVGYFDHCSRLIQIHRLKRKWVSADQAQIFVSAMHCMIYNCLVERLHLWKNLNLNVLKDDGIIFGFRECDDLSLTIHDETGSSLGEIIGTVNRL